MTNMFSGTDPGPSEDDVRKPTMPAFLETEPGSFKPIDECSREEIAAHVMSLMMQADALIATAKTLDQYLESRP